MFFDVTIGSCLLLFLGLMLISGGIIQLLFGQEYAAAVPIFRIHIGSIVLIGIGIAGSKWIVANGLQRVLVIISFSGAVTNVFANLILIPLYGGIGAAVATLISYSIAGYFSYLAIPSTRVIFFRASKSLLLPLRLLRGEYVGYLFTGKR